LRRCCAWREVTAGGRVTRRESFWRRSGRRGSFSTRFRRCWGWRRPLPEAGGAGAGGGEGALGSSSRDGGTGAELQGSRRRCCATWAANGGGAGVGRAAAAAMSHWRAAAAAGASG
jgi:hypothetical protein